METAFTPFASLLGGVLIGTAAVMLMLLHGRIAGATGILTGVLNPTDRRDWSWRMAMIAGMMTAPALWFLAIGMMPTIQVPVSMPVLMIGGLLVGVGVTLSSGCTSGHGVCGIARCSPRSFAATMSFMVTTFLTVYLVRHVFGS